MINFCIFLFVATRLILAVLYTHVYIREICVNLIESQD